MLNLVLPKPKLNKKHCSGHFFIRYWGIRSLRSRFPEAEIISLPQNPRECLAHKKPPQNTELNSDRLSCLLYVNQNYIPNFCLISFKDLKKKK